MGLLDEFNTPGPELSLGELAWQVAALLKIKSLKSKGRQPTSRALNQWNRQQALRDIDGLVVEAARRASVRRLDPRSPELVLQLKSELLRIARRAQRGPGRPLSRGATLWKMATSRREHGILGNTASAHDRQVRGRPSKMATNDERRWASYVFGVKHRLFAKRSGFWMRGYASVWNYLYQKGNASELLEIADIEAIRDARDRYKRALPPGSDRAQVARFRRALVRFKLVPPIPRCR